MLSKTIKAYSLVSVVLMICSCSSLNESRESDRQKLATAKVNMQLGMAYLEQHNVQRAKQKLLAALDQAPNSPEVWYSMGYFYEVTGNKAEAEKNYLKSVALAPKSGDVQNNFGTFLCRAGRYQESLAHFELAVKDEHYVDTAATYENAGLCALKIPNKQLAMNYLKTAIAQDPDRSSVYLELAELNFQNKKYELAKNELENFLNLSPPTEESYRLSDHLHAKLGSDFFVGEA